MKADHYDSFAASYSTDNESNLLNGYYERPAMIDLAGDVDGHLVLDAGCGSGPLSAALRAKGAVVTGFDSSSAMVELARQRLGESAPAARRPTPPMRAARGVVLARRCQPPGAPESTDHPKTSSNARHRQDRTRLPLTVYPGVPLTRCLAVCADGVYR